MSDKEIIDIYKLQDLFAIKTDFLASFRYLTAWAYYILIFALIFPKITKYVNVLFLSLYVLINSMIMTFIHPRYSKFDTKNVTYHLHLSASAYIDLMFHIAPFIIVMCLFFTQYRHTNAFGLSFFITFFIIIFYILCFDPEITYDIMPKNIVTGMILTLLVYTFITM